MVPTDKNKVEIQGLILRYLRDGKMSENCLSMKGIDDRSAAGVMEFVEGTLRKYGISTEGITSQSYDGASVMPGEYSGLQARVNELCGRKVL